MAAVLYCSQCKKKFKAPPNMEGKKLACPLCKSLLALVEDSSPPKAAPEKPPAPPVKKEIDSKPAIDLNPSSYSSDNFTTPEKSVPKVNRQEDEKETNKEFSIESREKAPESSPIPKRTFRSEVDRSSSSEDQDEEESQTKTTSKTAQKGIQKIVGGLKSQTLTLWSNLILSLVGLLIGLASYLEIDLPFSSTKGILGDFTLWMEILFVICFGSFAFWLVNTLTSRVKFMGTTNEFCSGYTRNFLGITQIIFTACLILSLIILLTVALNPTGDTQSNSSGEQTEIIIIGLLMCVTFVLYFVGELFSILFYSEVISSINKRSLVKKLSYSLLPIFVLFLVTIVMSATTSLLEPRTPDVQYQSAPPTFNRGFPQQPAPRPKAKPNILFGILGKTSYPVSALIGNFYIFLTELALVYFYQKFSKDLTQTLYKSYPGSKPINKKKNQQYSSKRNALDREEEEDEDRDDEDESPRRRKRFRD